MKTSLFRYNFHSSALPKRTIDSPLAPPYTYEPPSNASTPPNSVWHLEVLKNGIIVENIPLSSSQLTIGRLPMCEISLEHAVSYL